MKSFKKEIVRVFAFVLIFLALSSVCEFLLLEFEGNTYVTMNDLEREEDLEVVVIGNSEATRHFNPYLFQEMTGKNAFNFSRFSSVVTTQYFLMEKLFQTHKPEKVMVFFDPFTLYNPEESAFVQATVWPYLRNPADRIEYMLSLVSVDHAYLDRFFPWRLHMPRTPGGVITNVRNKVDDLLGNGHYYDSARESLNTDTSTYLGKGFAPLHEDQATTAEQINSKCKSTCVKKELQLHEDVKETIKKMAELCRENDCELIAVNIPRLPAVALSSMLNNYDAETRFFEELGVQCWNFNYAKADDIARLDASYYFDTSHMTWAGADVFTEALADVFNSYQRGEDVSDMFYTTEEYIASIDFVTNTWLTEKSQGDQIKLTAYANHGTEVVPEYCFVKIDEDGRETVLQDYSTENVCLASLESGEKFRLYTRNASNPEQPPLSFEFE